MTNKQINQRRRRRGADEARIHPSARRREPRSAASAFRSFGAAGSNGHTQRCGRAPPGVGHPTRARPRCLCVANRETQPRPSASLAPNGPANATRGQLASCWTAAIYSRDKPPAVATRPSRRTGGRTADGGGGGRRRVRLSLGPMLTSREGHGWSFGRYVPFRHTGWLLGASRAELSAAGSNKSCQPGGVAALKGGRCEILVFLAFLLGG